MKDKAHFFDPNKRAALKAGALCALGFAGFAALAPRGTAQTATKGLVKARRSEWFTSLGGGRVRCDLCPRACELGRGERGPCRVRENRGGRGYSLVYGNPSLLQIDPVERKPFFHVLPGERALSVSTAGCNIECKFCEVWDMALVAPEEVYAYEVTPDEVVRHARGAGARAVSYAFGEPVIFFEYMEAIARKAREAGLLNLLHTNGYIAEAPLRSLCANLDAANVDLKAFDETFYREVCAGELAPVLRTLRRLREEDVAIEITYPVIPSLNDDMEQIRAMCRWIVEQLGADTPVHFARFYPLYKLANLPPTPVRTLDRARDTARREGLRFVYVARVTGHEGENTFCPGCGKTVIERLGFVIENVHIEKGKCARCGHPVPGRWT